MEPTTSARVQGVALLGTAMILSWFFLMGIGGVLLVLLAYLAMSVASPALLVACVFLMSVPVLLTLLWGLSAIESGRKARALEVRYSVEGTVEA